VNTPVGRFPAAALAACVLGLVICPFLYIAVGALSGFSPAFSVVMLPPLLLGSGFLLWRFLSKPTDRATISVPLLLMEGLSWVAIVAFLFLVSGFNLLRGLERFGVGSGFFLVGSVGGVLIVLLRRPALEQRLTRLPKGVAIAALVSLLALAGFAAIATLMTPPAFI
jgi:hypothetical protein